LLIACDLDADNLPRAHERLQPLGSEFELHHSNFAGLAAVAGERSNRGVNVLLADLGMSSMQVDDPARGFSYMREGPLDMRMDRTRGRSAADILARISVEELSQALADYGDEPNALRVAQAIVQARETQPLASTTDLARLLQVVNQQEDWKLHPAKGKWNIHPAARTFQALRILVNRELASLEHLLRLIPTLLAPGGRAGIISFHSGEDRLVKASFLQGLRSGIYQQGCKEAIRPGRSEAFDNPRSRSAKFRWVVRA
jgi:16S rRNA (cytosine1402-N4)-methyltransferase